MKLITLFFTALISFSTSAYWCGQGQIQLVAWGSVVDVECTETVVFDLPVELNIKDFDIVIEEVGGFECQVETITNSAGKNQIVVNWLAGTDSSGCSISLFSRNGVEHSSSQLFMSY